MRWRGRRAQGSTDGGWGGEGARAWVTRHFPEAPLPVYLAMSGEKVRPASTCHRPRDRVTGSSCRARGLHGPPWTVLQAGGRRWTTPLHLCHAPDAHTCRSPLHGRLPARDPCRSTVPGGRGGAAPAHGWAPATATTAPLAGAPCGGWSSCTAPAAPPQFGPLSCTHVRTLAPLS